MRQVGEYQNDHFPCGGCVLLRLDLRFYVKKDFHRIHRTFYE